MTAAIDISKEQRKTLSALLRQFIPGVEVWAYGSRVQWTARSNSDLDLVAFTTPAQSPLVSELKEALAESDLPFLVDFHVWDEVPERFHEIIRREYVVLQEVTQPARGSGMPGWKSITLGDFVALQRGHDLTEPERRPGHVPVIGSAGQNGFHDTALAKGPGIVIGRSGASFGQVHFCSTDYWPHNTGLYVTDFKGNDPRFAYYFLKALDFDRYNSGSAQPSLNRNFIYPIPICVPESDEQKAIAHILGTLDDKIELNRRMNATLEAMARALFQSWFVEFAPVRAKLDGRKPAGLDAATAALFPSHFQNSTFVHIPLGWTVEPVGEVVECVGGGTPSTTEPKFWEGGTHHWTTPKDFSSLKAPILLDTDRKISDAGVAKISSGLLPAGTLLLSSRAPVGYLAITAMPVAINQGFIALKCNERASNYFMLNWCQTNIAEIESRATGTTFAEISKTNFRPILVELPPKELMAAFTEKVAPLYAQITANLQQSRTFATIRDALLPKLLSGELSVLKDSKLSEGAIP